MIKGRIHSLESMGLVDGPGIRFIVFMQGCRLRCAYCHNPDTWCMQGGTEYDPEELVNKIKRYKTYFKASGGGVTFSGGEPLLQVDFLIECLKLCRENGIHVTIDTAGCGVGRYEEILEYVDLVLFDVKHIDKVKYKELVGVDISESMKFLNTCIKLKKKLWIRHVVVPGITDSKEHLDNLKKFVDTLENVEKVELLPYHVLGVNKYEVLGINYKLEGVKPLNKEELKKIENKLFNKK